jgi:hypothetical protein
MANNYFMFRTRFASPIKEMVTALLLSAGVDRMDAVAMVDGELKEAPCNALGGKTPRYALQTLGTEWGRTVIHKDIWVMNTMAKVNKQLSCGMKVIIDDVRFPNEVAAVKKAGGLVVNVRRDRDESDPRFAHISEELRLDYDMVIDNNSTLDDLKHQIICLFGLPK